MRKIAFDPTDWALEQDLIMVAKMPDITGLGYERAYKRVEEAFYALEMPTNAAMEAAIKAIEHAKNVERTRKTKGHKKMQFIESNEGGFDSKNFLKLKDGDKVSGIFRGDIHHFKQHWLDKKSQECTGPDCPHCKSGLKPSFRFRVNFITKEGDKFTTKLFEQGWKVYEALRGMDKEYKGVGGIEKVFVSVTRSGKDSNTTYMVLPLMNWQVQEGAEKKLSAVPLLDVKQLSLDEPVAAMAETNDIPF